MPVFLNFRFLGKTNGKLNEFAIGPCFLIAYHLERNFWFPLRTSLTILSRRIIQDSARFSKRGRDKYL